MNSISSGDPIDFTFTLSGFGNEFEHIQNHSTTFDYLFFIGNVIFPEGRCRSLSSKGPLVFTYALFGSGNEYDSFEI